MKRKVLSCFLALCMLVSMMPFGIFSVSAATTTSETVMTITIVDGYGNPLPGATVTATRTYLTAGGNQRTVNVTLTNNGDGSFSFDTKLYYNGTTKYYTVNASKDGYPSVTQQIDPAARAVVVMLGEGMVEPEPELPDEWVTFDMYYIATGITPESFAGAGAAIDYGPSYNDVPFVQVNVNISALKNKKYADCVLYEENTDGNSYHFVPAGDIEGDDVTEEQKRALIKPFWAAVVECMDDASRKALDETGLADSFMGYAVKNQGSALNPDNHCDGILSVEPPVYVVEMHERGSYFGGFVNDNNSTTFTTIDDVLAAYNLHFNQQIDWVKQSDGSY